MIPPPFILESHDGLRLSVKVQPRASRNQIVGALGKELKIAVTAPPVDSAANAGLIDFLREKLGCSRSAIQIERGGTSRHKTLKIQGFSADQLLAKLQLP